MADTSQNNNSNNSNINNQAPAATAPVPNAQQPLQSQPFQNQQSNNQFSSAAPSAGIPMNSAQHQHPPQSMQQPPNQQNQQAQPGQPMQMSMQPQQQQQQQMMNPHQMNNFQQVGMQQQHMSGNQMQQQPQQINQQMPQHQMAPMAQPNGSQPQQNGMGSLPQQQMGIQQQHMQHPGQSTSPKPNMMGGNVPQGMPGQQGQLQSNGNGQPMVQGHVGGHQNTFSNGMQQVNSQQGMPAQLQQGQPMQQGQQQQHLVQPQGQGQPGSAQAPQSGQSSQRTTPPSWYDQEGHIAERRKMVTSIAMLLQQRKPNAPTEWMKKLPQMARRLEESLFKEAESFEKYKDQDTLKKRLQKLAQDMGVRAKQSAAAAAAAANSNNQGGGGGGGGSDSNGAMRASMPPNTSEAPNPGTAASHQTQEQRQQVLRQQQQRLLLLRHASKCPHGEARVVVTEQNHSEGARVLRGKDWKWGDQDGGPGSMGILGKKRAEGWVAVLWEKTRSEREYRIGGEGAFDLMFGGCPVTQHCAGMRTLWKHIAECKDQQCQTPHCVSSRYVLSHYHRCRERSCAVCQPVREAIQRNHDKAKEIETKQKGTKNPAPEAKGSKAKKGKSAASNMGDGNNSGGGGNNTKKPRLPKKKGGTANGVEPQPEIEEPIQQHSSIVPLPHKPAIKKTPDPTTSMIYSFTTEQISEHIAALTKPVNLKPGVIKQKCFPVLKKMMDSEFGWIFSKPVDPVALNLPDYFEVIKKPMDMGTMKKKLENSVYRDINEFPDDLRLVFDNAITYNGANSEVTEVAKKMKKTFDLEWKKVEVEMKKEEDNRKSKGEMCSLCCKGNLHYFPTSYYCNGNGCNGAKIRRNSYYYCDSRNKYHWCPQCYGELPSTIEMAEANLEKAELQKKKNDEMFEEPWVGCDECPRWVHQICALFNGRKNNTDTTVYHCPFCVLDSRKKLNVTEGTVKYKGASEIPHTRASAFLEKRVRNKLATEQRRIMSEDGVAAENVPRPGKLHVRQLSNLKDKCHQVRPRMYERYKDQGFPMEFPVTSKCIVLFEEIEGVDVILFGMYLYEYGHKCPQPNHRRVYVSYLDSVHYFQPRQYRTMVYHEMLVAYLAYAKLRGFHTCHIWSCPPFKGDDYIFFCHPEEQKTPKDDRLRNWYMSMLAKCEAEGTVVKLTTLYDECFKGSDAKVVNVPYFEGDHWILEAEAILKAIEDEKESRTSDKAKGGKANKKSKGDKKGKRGLRSDGDVEELNGRDPLLMRMGKTLEPMKDAFIVAHLHSREFAAEKWEQRLKEIEQEEKDEAMAPGGSSSSKTDDDASNNKKLDETAISSTLSKKVSNNSNNDKKAAESNVAEKVKEEKVEGETPASESEVKKEPEVSESKDTKEDVKAAADETTSKEKEGSTEEGGNGMAVEENKDMKKEDAKEDVKTEEQKTDVKTETASGESAEATPPAQDEDGSAKKQGEDANPDAMTDDKKEEVKETKPKVDFPATDDNDYPPFDPPADELEDMDEQMESEFFDTRQQFLNLCQGNHYQFDEIRRAKHTSMMALYHIHNPDKPKFLTACSICGVDINSGFQYDCDQCPEFHMCHKCLLTYQMQHKPPPHEHRLKKVVVQSESGQLTEEQKKQRKRSIELHMQLLAHASTCRNAECPSANCEKMKNLLAHGTKCQVKIQGGCNVCRRIWALLQIHARQCRRTNCQVPKCRQLKEQLRNVELQQAAMDERRRLAMNEQYSQRPAAAAEDK